MDERLRLLEGAGPEIGRIQQPHPAALGLAEQGLEQGAGHTAETHPCGAGSAAGKAPQQWEGVLVGATGQLQGPGRRLGAQPLQQPHGGMGGAIAHIAAHRPAIQLPEGP